MNRRFRPAYVIAALLAIVILCALFASRAGAATQAAGFRWEKDLGTQKLTPTSSTALTVPAGTTHAEIYIESAAVFIRWDAGVVVDASGTAFKWPEGHHRKEENDGLKLRSLRLKCAACTVWVNYSRERRTTD